MRVVCNQCSHEHIIPDESIHNRKVYFYCKNCAHKIIIKGKSDQNECSSSGMIQIRKIPTISDIFDTIPRFFNLSSFLISFIFIIFTVITGTLALLLATNQTVLTDYPAIIIGIVFVLTLILVFTYVFVTYTVSKIHYYKLSNPNTKSIDWKFIFFDAREDSTVLFIFSSGLLILTLMIFSPVYFLGEYGIAYSSVMFYPMTLSVFFLCITVLLHDFIPAIVAIPSLPVVAQISNLFRFIRREIVNLPLYMATVAIICSIVSVIITAIITGTIMLTVSAGALLSGSSLKSIAIKAIPSVTGFFSSKPADSSILPDYISVSVILLAVFLFILFTALLAVLFNLRVALVAHSCWIMNENREHSVPRNALIAGLGIIVLIFFAVVCFASMKTLHLL